MAQLPTLTVTEKLTRCFIEKESLVNPEKHLRSSMETIMDISGLHAKHNVRQKTNPSTLHINLNRLKGGMELLRLMWIDVMKSCTLIICIIMISFSSAKATFTEIQLMGLSFFYIN